MNETTRTGAFVAVALLAVVLAWATGPRSLSDSGAADLPDEINKIDDPTSAKRLEIVQFDEDQASLKDFKVAEVDGLWVIPSHDNYPADADQQMADAATSLMNLQVLGEADPERDPSRHAEYGVVEPDKNKLKVGDKGVGMRVTMRDADDKKLVDLIIGKEVPDQPGQRYVREVGKDPVYLVELDTSKLSTDFGVWIEKDLLKINTFDIRQVTLKDYSVDVQPVVDQGQLVLGIDWRRRGELTVGYDNAKSEWKLEDFKLFDSRKGPQGDYVPEKLSPDQQLDSKKLNDLRSALDDLKIVDVARKPEGMSRDLKASADFLKNREAQESLMRRGFFPMRISNNEAEILSKEGETICQMNDGVEYVLRFGSIAGEQANNGNSKDPGAAPSTNVNRYLFVMARYDDSVIEKPKLEEVPPLPEGAQPKPDQPKPDQAKPDSETPETKADADKAAKDAASGEETGGEGASDDAASDDPAKSEAAPSDAQGSDDSAAPKDGADSESPDQAAAVEPLAAAAATLCQVEKDQEGDSAADDAEARTDSASDQAKDPLKEETSDKESDEKSADEPADAAAPKADEKATSAKSGDEKTGDEADKPSPKEKTVDEIVAEQKRITMQNERKQKEYNDKVEAAKKKVNQLNARFGDWYFIISDEVYQKIHLGKDDVIETKEKPAEEGAKDKGGALSEFDKLQKGLPAKK